MSTTAQSVTETVYDSALSAETTVERSEDNNTIRCEVGESDVGKFYGLSRRLGLTPDVKRHNGTFTGTLTVESESDLSYDLNTLLTVFESVFSSETEVSLEDGTITGVLAEKDIGTYFRLSRTLNFNGSKKRENGDFTITVTL